MKYKTILCKVDRDRAFDGKNTHTLSKDSLGTFYCFALLEKDVCTGCYHLVKVLRLSYQDFLRLSKK